VALGRNPGIVVGVLDADGPRYVAVGSSGRPGSPLDTATVFEAGSVTKVLTADLLALLVARGEVSLDDPVSTHVEALPTLRGAEGRPVRLTDLATHTSGLPRIPSNLAPADASDPYAGYGGEALVAFLSGVSLPSLPAPHQYSNLGAGLLGFALGRASGQGYEGALREHVLEPLGMASSGFASEPGLVDRLAQGHAPRGEPTGPWHFDALAGAGALLSTAPDLLRFAAAHLVPPPGRLGSALASTLEIRVPAGPAPKMSQALGWVVDVRDPDDPIVWHNGGTGGFRSFVGLRPRHGTAVVVLTNQATSVDDLGFHILDPARPLAPPPPAETVSEVRLPGAVLRRYVGRYRLAPDVIIEVTLAEGTLYAQATGQGRLRLAPVDRSRFRVVGVDAAVTFGGDPAVDHLILHQGGRDQRAERMEGR
jgi:CubicO group peptidase (beta-lactamase class C family)